MSPTIMRERKGKGRSVSMYRRLLLLIQLLKLLTASSTCWSQMTHQLRSIFSSWGKGWRIKGQEIRYLARIYNNVVMLENFPRSFILRTHVLIRKEIVPDSPTGKHSFNSSRALKFKRHDLFGSSCHSHVTMATSYSPPTLITLSHDRSSSRS
jgi:hypothetical protein